MEIEKNHYLLSDKELSEYKNLLTSMLTYMVHSKASDLHLSAGRRPRFRIDGDLIRVEEFATVLQDNDIHKLIAVMLSKQQHEKFVHLKEMDSSYNIENLSRFRINCFDQARGAGVVIRQIPNVIPSLDDLNFIPHVVQTLKDLGKRKSGLILVTGPTGSGKSTTLAAIIDYINENRKEHIITIEDPIEFIHGEKACLINQREVHQNTDSFTNALRASLREDPDIILVGELRDLETIRLALTAAETGHLVFATLHTTSAASSISRILDVFPAEEKDMVRTMLSSSLSAVIAQTLIKKTGGGRVGLHEVFILNGATRNQIRSGKLTGIETAIQTGIAEGMISKVNALNDLLRSGLIERETFDQTLELINKTKL